MASPDEVSHSVLIRAKPEAVYDLFATAAGLDSWFTTGAEVDSRAGGAIVYRWIDWGPDSVTTESRGVVRVAERPLRFVFAWDSDDGRPTTVEMRFEPTADGTVMRLREYGFSAGERGRIALLREASGWGEAMTLAKFRLEHGLRY